MNRAVLEPWRFLSKSKAEDSRGFHRNFRFAVLLTTIAEGPITFVLLTASPPS